MATELLIAAMILATLSGLPGLCMSRLSVWGQRIAAVAMMACMGLGLAAVVLAFNGQPAQSSFPWPVMGNGWIKIDALSAWFLCPVLLIGGLGPIFGLAYWAQRRHPGNGQQLSLFWGLLVASLLLLVVSHHALIFLLGWEGMALSAFFLIATEVRKTESRKAAFVYLIATHLGTLSLFALFLIWYQSTGSWDFVQLAINQIGLDVLNVMFFLALLGFGLKAGVMPLHFWLPGAHANAPTHVSAILSGVVLKMGIYGLLRFLFLLPAPPPAWGSLILALGTVSAVLGVLFAIAQHDIKRLLAYHSIENIGIILMGLGLALLGRSSGNMVWLVLGLGGCLLHVWNHSLFKSLLFFGAGSVIHRTHSRQIDRLGGLAKAMPWTAVLFLTGAVAICGLPPLNGFISELLVYLGLFKAVLTPGSAGLAIALAIPALALVGALALACFVKVYGAVFLGEPRVPLSKPIRESPPPIIIPMLILALLCLAIGLGSVVLVPLLDVVIGDVAALSAGMVGDTLPSLGALSPLLTIGWIGIGLLGLIMVIAGIGWLSRRHTPIVPTWDCAYVQPTARMQYTASSMAQTIVGLFKWVLRPHEHKPKLVQAFPAAARLESEVEDSILDRVLMPASIRIRRTFSWFHRFQQGLTQHYIAYIVVILIIILATLIPFGEIWARLLAR